MVNNAELLYLHTHGVRSSEMRAEMQKNTDAGMKYSAAHSPLRDAAGNAFAVQHLFFSTSDNENKE